MDWLILSWTSHQCQLAIPHLRRSTSPRVIVLSSACDFNVPYHGWMPYCTTKAAVTRFVHILGLENPDILVQGVYPKLTDTKMPSDVIAGKYNGIMTDDEVALFQAWAKDGISLEPPAWCGEAVARLAIGSDKGGESGKVMYYYDQVPDLQQKRMARP
jgi:NAD(P)-dependent dehydrogenase (short-subunit alcohol dehydrogenase family)